MMYSKLKLYGKIAGLSSIKPRIPFLSQKHGMSDKYLFSILTPYGKIKPTINAIYRGDRMKKINGILCLLLSKMKSLVKTASLPVPTFPCFTATMTPTKSKIFPWRTCRWMTASF